MLKKFALVSGSLFLILVIACSGGGTVDPNTMAENTNSLSSSSNGLSETENGMDIKPVEVSSSSEISDMIDGGIAHTKDFSLQCLDNVDPLSNSAELSDDTERDSVASRKVGDDGFDTIVIPQMYMSCGAVFERFDVYASDGTLYVDLVEAADSPITNCVCPTRVSFRIEHNEAFFNTQYLVFGRQKFVIED